MREVMRSDRKLFRRVKQLAKSKKSDATSPIRNRDETALVEKMSTPKLVDLHIPVREPTSKDRKRKRMSSASVRKIDTMFMPGNPSMLFQESADIGSKKIKRQRPLSSKPILASPNIFKLNGNLSSDAFLTRPTQRPKRGV